jgi:ParB family chromosome partitioning protein
MESIEVKATKKNDMMLIDPQNIVVVDNFNVRKDYGDIDSLSESIINNGQLEPVICVKIRGTEQYKLVEGHRRLMAIKQAISKGYDIPYVKALTLSSTNEEDHVFAMLITGTGKKPLTPLEEAEGYKRLVAYGYETKDIAIRVGKSNTHVYNLVRLADIPKKLKDKIENNEVSTSVVIQLIKHTKNADDIVSEIEKALSETKDNSVKKKITAKNVKTLMTPLQKFKSACAIAEEKEFKNSDLFRNLLTEMLKKDSTPESIAEIFS